MDDDSMFLKIKEYLAFSTISSELDYLKTSIDILIKNYQIDFQKNDEIFKSKVEEIKKTDLYNKALNEVKTPYVTHDQMMMEGDLKKPFFELQTFSQIIIESLLIKHIACIENTIVKLSYIIQTKENEKIAPDYNISGIFTDMLKAIDYIALVTNSRIRIKDLKNWKMIYHLRVLRHKLAHGENNFELKEGVINEINREIRLINKKLPIFKECYPSMGLAQYGYEASLLKPNESNMWNCSICSDINVLQKINQICVEFIEDVKKSILAFILNNCRYLAYFSF